jgi:hypothetical protein
MQIRQWLNWKRRIILGGFTFLFVVLLLTLPSLAISEEGESFSAQITGRKTWSLSYGIGDPHGLAQAGMAPYQLSLDQSLAVDITAEALSMLTVKAHFNDQEPASMQSLTVNLDAGNLTGVFGDFAISGKEAFAVYNKKLKGARLEYVFTNFHDATLTGILSQIEGISESRTFIGRTAHAEVLFSSSPPGEPWIDQPYRLNIAGLYAYNLAAPFIEDFSTVELAFDSSSALQTLLTSYGLGYLSDTIASSPSSDLTVDSFVVVSNEDDFLLLKREPASLLRTRLEEAIKTYNQENDLTGTEKKRYPFNVGTDYERAFLDQLASSVAIVVDGENYPLISGIQHRFYTLGRTDLKEGSIRVEVSLDGGTFLPISNPEFSSYRVTPFPNEGIIELDFPESFFAGEKSAVSVSFDYAISGDMFMLGFSLVPGSEKVYLNGTLLQRNVDYSIDYDVGALILFTEAGEKDTIRIDYERYRGGLGGAADYARNFYGVSFDLPLSDALTFEVSLLQAADSPTPIGDQDKTRTMPNTHTVSGVVGSVNLDGFNAHFTLGYNDNRFPFDDNLRTSLPNMTTSLLAITDYTFVGTLGGLSVYHDGTWNTYNTSDGLAGNRIHSIVSESDRVFLATSSGLTVLDLSGDAPLAQVRNWHRYYREDGLPNSAIHDLLLLDGTLWIGTEEGFAAVKLADLDDRESWDIHTEQAFTEHGAILSLAGEDKQIYLGTESGLFVFDTQDGTLTEVPGMSGLRINDLLIANQTLYVASDRGLRAVHNGVGAGWLTFGEEVNSLAWVDGELWYGSESGLHRGSGGGDLFTDWEITSVAVDPEGTVWAGSRADEDYQLRVWRIDTTIDPFENAETGIDGRDRSRFSDIDATDHTDRGILGRVDFHRQIENASLSGTFESVSPTFTSIGRLGRSDSTGWTLQGTARPIDEVNLSASHNYHLIDQSGERPRTTVENAVSLSLDIGPSLALSLNQGMVNDDVFHRGFDDGTFYYTFDVQDQLFEEKLGLSLHWRDAFSKDFILETSHRENSLSVNGTYQVTPEISLAADWGRPLTFTNGDSTGSEKWGLSANWNTKFDQITIKLAYTFASRRSLPVGTFRTTQEAKLDLRLDPFDLYDWKLTPSLNLGVANKEGLLSLTVTGTLRAVLDPFSARATYNHEISGLGEERMQTKKGFTLNIDYTGLPDLKPNLSYSQNTSAVTYRGEARPTVTRNLTGRLTWTPADGTRDRLSLSVRGVTREEETTLTATLTNSYTFSYALFDEEIIPQPLSLRLDLDGRYEGRTEGPDLSLSFKGNADLTLSDTWSASFAASYLTGTKSTEGIYHSLLFELFVAAKF